MRRENKQRRVKEKASSRGLSTNYLEPDNYEDEDEGGISIAAIKGKYKKQKNGVALFLLLFMAIYFGSNAP